MSKRITRSRLAIGGGVLFFSGAFLSQHGAREVGHAHQPSNSSIVATLGDLVTVRPNPMDVIQETAHDFGDPKGPLPAHSPGGQSPPEQRAAAEVFVGGLLVMIGSVIEYGAITYGNDNSTQI